MLTTSIGFNYLLGDLVALPAGDGGALALGDLLGLDPGHQGADTPGLLLAVPDGNLLAGLAVELLAVDLGHLDAPHLGDVGALLAGELAALTLGDVLAVCPGDVLAFLLLHSLALPLIDIIADLLGDLATLLLGLLRALLGGDVTADLRVVNLLTHLAGHGVADLGVDSVALLLIGGRALLAGNVLQIKLTLKNENAKRIMYKKFYEILIYACKPNFSSLDKQTKKLENCTLCSQNGRRVWHQNDVEIF